MEEVMVLNLLAIPNAADKIEEPFSDKTGLPNVHPHYKNIFLLYSDTNICPSVIRFMKHKHTIKNCCHKVEKHLCKLNVVRV
jgi:hypothetical protein